MINLEPQDLKETPVDIATFITDPNYLGSVFSDIYPYWKDVLQDVYANPLRSKYTDVVLAGCLGAGRTTAAVVGFLYDLYILTLVKDPHSKWCLLPKTPLNLALVIKGYDSPLIDMVFDALSVSPYFKSILLGDVATLKEDMFPNHIGIVLATTKHFYLGRAILGAIFELENDEDREVKSDADMESYYDSCHRRMVTRFMGDEGIVPCHMWMVTSAHGLLTNFLKDRIDYYRDDDRIFVAEPSIWDVQAFKGIYCGDTFVVCVEDGTGEPRIIQEEEIGEALLHGRILRVPVEYRSDFKKDAYASIVELAGIPVEKPKPKRPGLVYREENFDLSVFFNNPVEISRATLYGIGLIFAFILGVIYGMYGV